MQRANVIHSFKLFIGPNFNMVFIIWDTFVVGLHFIFHFEWVMLPWQPISLIGIAVAFYLGFKNNLAMIDFKARI